MINKVSNVDDKQAKSTGFREGVHIRLRSHNLDVSVYEIVADKLHRHLSIEKRLGKWIDDAAKEYGYDSSDFRPMHQRHMKRKKNFYLSLNMAKELALLEGTKEALEVVRAIRHLQREQSQMQAAERLTSEILRLIHPKLRTSYLLSIKDDEIRAGLDPEEYIDELHQRGAVSDEEYREQRILNELIFPYRIRQQLGWKMRSCSVSVPF